MGITVECQGWDPPGLRPWGSELEQAEHSTWGTPLTRAEALVTWVEALYEQAGAQPDTLQVAAALVQVDQEDVVPVELQACPAGTGGGHSHQACRTQAQGVAYPLSSQPQLSSDLDYDTALRDLAPHHAEAHLGLPHLCPVSVSPFLGVLASQLKGN